MNDKKQIEICEKCKIKDTCSNRILVHMEKCKVNDCDYYIEITLEEKQIEEMARDIPSDIVAYDGKSYGLHLYIEQKQYIAKKLLQQGYRKIPQNNVVLSMEKYNDLKGLEKKFDDYLIKEIVATRNETAKKIFSDLHRLIYSDKTTPIWVKQQLSEIAKQYGVEIGE